MEQENQTTSNKRIAKNALMLYIRMFLTMIVGLYTSRVVLATLGVEDYGIYGVVGGVVAMMGFLNASMSGATSRFLTFELGRGDKQRLADTFSSALIVHIGIALVVFVLAETVGLWFLCNKLVIPEGRMAAAHWVYQCSILSAMLSITQAPYNASIIAHEKMDVYAYVEILNVSLKLLIVYLLVIGNFDKLKLYAVLTLAVGVTIMLIYRIYCIRRFPETHFRLIWNKSILRPLLSFSGWDLYGNASVAIRQHGTNFLINVYFGVFYNAASGIAATIQSVLLGFTQQILTAFRPQIIKLYSTGYRTEAMRLIYKATKLSSLLIAIIAIPFCFHMKLVLSVWLTVVPPKTIIFCQLLLVAGCFNLLRSSLMIGIHSTGHIKVMSIITGSFYILSVFVVLIAFMLGANVSFAYVVSILLNVILLIVLVLIINYLIEQFSIYEFLKDSLLPFSQFIVVISSILLVEKLLFAKGFSISEPLLLLVDILISFIIAVYIGLNKQERHIIKRFFHLFYEYFT